MKPILKGVLKYLLTVFCWLSVGPLLLFLCFSLDSLFDGRVYETNDIADYGNITGNYDNKKPKEFIQSFFPLEIAENFSNVVYHYKAISGDAYAYEAYLEFVIAEKEEYKRFVSDVVDFEKCIPFTFDSNFHEYTISHIFRISNSSERYSIDFAKTGKILFSDDEQRLIFAAMGVYDGGYADTEDLGYFFQRFNIDPEEFATTLYVEKEDGSGVMVPKFKKENA